MLNKLSKKESNRIETEFETLLNSDIKTDYLISEGIDIWQLVLHKCIFQLVEKKYDPIEIVTYNQLFELSNRQSEFENDISERRKNAPIWETALKYIIDDIYNEFGNGIFQDRIEQYEKLYLVGRTYKDINKGKIIPISTDFDIHNYVNETGMEIHLNFKNNPPFSEMEYAADIMLCEYLNGICYAYNLPILEKEFLSLTTKSNSNESEQKEFTLTHKQQILLLKELGLFETVIFKNFTTEKKGKIIGSLLGKDNKNTENYIRYSGGYDTPKKYDIHTETNKEIINKLLK
jgi:hypothetical protein